MEVFNKQQLHIAMFPWFAMGHITSFMHLSNKFAEQGHRITFFLPSNSVKFISTLISNHDLISLVSIPLPLVPGLNPNIQTTADSSQFHIHSLLATSMDRCGPFIQSSLQTLKPHFIFYDFAYWLPKLANNLGILAVNFLTVNASTIAHMFIPDSGLLEITEDDLCTVPDDFPHPCVALTKFEARLVLLLRSKEFGEGVTFSERLMSSAKNSNALLFKTCREMDGHYLDYIEKHSNKPVLTAGPTIPIPPSTPLKEEIAAWFSKFDLKSVIYCALGSEMVLSLSLFHELVLGMELTEQPFFMRLKPPTGFESIENALPEGFKERCLERGIVTGEWVQQLQILRHESVGCFVTHCGSGSFTEGLISECQLVMLPVSGEQNMNARVMGRDLRVGIEVKLRDEDNSFDRYGVCKAVKEAMDIKNGVGKEVKINHEKWRSVLLRPRFESSCMEECVMKLTQLAAAAAANIK